VGRIVCCKKAGGYAGSSVTISTVTQGGQAMAEEPVEACSQGSKPQYKILVLQVGGVCGQETGWRAMGRRESCYTSWHNIPEDLNLHIYKMLMILCGVCVWSTLYKRHSWQFVLQKYMQKKNAVICALFIVSCQWNCWIELDTMGNVRTFNISKFAWTFMYFSSLRG
jgi:hypothetical protein